MKVLLHIGCNAGSESMPKFFREQCEYTEVRLDDSLTHHLNELKNVGYVPDTIFMQIQSDTIGGQSTESLLAPFMRYWKSVGSYVINWTGDMRNQLPQWMVQFSPNVSVTMFSNWRDVDRARAMNIPSGFLQQGIDTDIFTPEGPGREDTPEIVFLANNYGNQFPLSHDRRMVVDKLYSHFKGRFRVYGNGWGAGSGNVNGSQRDEAAVYRACKIAISVSHYNSDGYFSDRLGRSLCSGAFVLSHHYEGLERDFQPGKHLDTFHNLNELVSKCESYLADTTARERIRAEGCEYARENLSYENIVKQILRLS